MGYQEDPQVILDHIRRVMAIPKRNKKTSVYDGDKAKRKIK